MRVGAADARVRPRIEIMKSRNDRNRAGPKNIPKSLRSERRRARWRFLVWLAILLLVVLGIVSAYIRGR